MGDFGQKIVGIVSRSSLGFKEFLFHYVRTIIPMFALQTRAAHLLFDCPPDTLRCALTASQSSVGEHKIRRGTHRMPLLIIIYTRECASLIIYG